MGNSMTDTHHRRADWETRYRQGKTAWDRGAVSPALLHWLDAGLVPTGRVLVPGCGHGHEVEALVRAGCQVTAVDIAPTPVLALMGRLADAGLHANVVQADLLHWTPAEPFEAIYEQTCLCALDPPNWSEYARRLAGWLLPGGRLFALFMQTGREGGPPYHCALPAMRELFDERDWQWPASQPFEIPHSTGLSELACVLTRRA
jgi:SAM-dependent methyltransferase